MAAQLKVGGVRIWRTAIGQAQACSAKHNSGDTTSIVVQ